MTDEVELDGPAGIPRSNGEPVFGAPWQSRAFGMALAANQSGALDWEEFRQELIRGIEAAERAGEYPEVDEDHSAYYGIWLEALVKTLSDSGSLEPDAFEQRRIDFLDGTRRELF